VLPNERSEIIRDAFQAIYGADAIVRVAAAVRMAAEERQESQFRLDAAL
jgi:hypothetical protein